MATIKSEIQTPTTVTISLDGLASGNFVIGSTTLTHTTNDPLDVIIELTGSTSNTPAGNRQLLLYAKSSIDSTNFSSGPESGTTTTDEPDLIFIGSLPMNSGSSTTHRRTYSLAAAYGGVLPAATKLIVKNDMGVTLTTGSIKVAEVWGVTA